MISGGRRESKHEQESQSGDRAGEQGDGGVLGFIGVAGLAHVITVLEVEPELGADTESFTQTDGAVGSNAPAAMDKVTDATGGDAGGLREAILADARGFEEFMEQDLARMDTGDAVLIGWFARGSGFGFHGKVAGCFLSWAGSVSCLKNVFGKIVNPVLCIKLNLMIVENALYARPRFLCYVAERSYNY